MKKILYILLTAPLLVFSCKKEHSASPVTHSQKLCKVAFNVANFQQQGGTFALKPHVNSLRVDSLTSPNTYLDVLYYVVFDSNQSPVKEKYQDSTMANMGMITDSLPAGNYTIAIVAGKKGLQIGTDPGTESYFTYPNNYWQDTFYGSFPLTVGTENVSQNVTLTRDVSKLEIQLSDNTLPSTVDSLVVDIYEDPSQKDLVNGQPLGLASQAQPVTYSFLIPASAKNKPGFTKDIIIANAQGVFVDIGWKDSNNKLAFVPNSYMPLTINPNTTLVLSGYLFPANQSPQTFLVKADTAWSTTTTQTNFSLRTH